MEQGPSCETFSEKRSDPRKKGDRYFSVEFIAPYLKLVYQFRLWNISGKGLCILVRQDSDIIPHLKVGKTLEMKYSLEEDPNKKEIIETEIRHVTPSMEGRFKGHYMVGLNIL